MFEQNPYIHSSTFGGNPLAARACLAALAEITRLDVPALAAARGAELLRGCAAVASAHPDLVREVRGRGLLVGVEFTDPDIAGLVIAGLAQRGIIAAYGLNKAEVVRFEPPAVIPSQEIAYVCQALGQALEQTRTLLSEAE
jgi:putrescine aminotransferase